MFRVCRPPRLLIALWEIGEKDVAQDGEWQGNNPINNKEPGRISVRPHQSHDSWKNRVKNSPPPPSMPMHAIQIRISSRLQKPTKHTPHRPRQPKNHSPLPQLLGRIPTPQQIMDTGIKPRFEESHHESERVEGLVAFHARSADGGDAPAYFEGGDDPARGDAGEEEVGGDLTDYVADGPDGG